MRALRFRRLLAGLGVALAFFLSVVGVQGGDPRGAWHSKAFQILNLEPQEVSFTARFLSPGGNVAHSITDTLAPGQARFYGPAELPQLPETFTGTLAVSATGQVALEVLHLGTNTGGNEILEIVDEGAMGRFAHTPIDRCTVLLVHNPAPTGTLVVLEVYQPDGTIVGTQEYTIPPEGLLRIVPSQDLGLPVDFHGSAVLMANHPIQVTVVSYCGGLSAFVAPSQGSTRLFLPHFPPSMPGLVTATLMIRNLGTTVAEGEIIYATGVTVPVTLPPAGIVPIASPAAYFIYLPLVGKGQALGSKTTFPGAVCPSPSYSAIISMTVPVAAVVQVADGRSSGGSWAYRSFALEGATPAAAFPILFAGYEGWWTGNRIWVRNVGEQGTTVQMRYVTVPTGTVVWDSLPSLPPGEIAQVSVPPLPDGADRAAAIFLADQPIVALAGAFNVRPGIWDRHIRYPATNFHFTCQQVEAADFIWAPITPTVGSPVSFNAVFTPYTATPPISYTWDFGDGSTGAGNPAVHTYTVPGLYTVTVTARNCLGFGQASATYAVRVVPQPYKLLSAYTPFPPIGPQPLTLPWVVGNYWGANSHLAIQNQFPQSISATVFGIPPTPFSSTIPSYTTWYVDVGDIITGFQGAASVDATGDFFAIDHQIGPDMAWAYQGVPLPPRPSPLYCPELYKNVDSWNSSMTVINLSTYTVTVNVTLSGGYYLALILGPGDSYLVHLLDIPGLPDGRYSGVVSANGEVWASCWTGGGRWWGHPALFSGWQTLYAPSVYEPITNTEASATLVLMNVATATARVTVTVGMNVYSFTLPPSTSIEPLPPGAGGSAVVESTAPLVGLVRIWGAFAPGDPYAVYELGAAPYPFVFFPLAPKNQPEQNCSWNATLVVQNTSPTATATVGVTFYDDAGNAYQPTDLGLGLGNPFFLAPRQAQSIFLELIPDLPDGRYSVVVSGDRALVGVALLRGECQGIPGNRGILLPSRPR